ncbi:DNA cytosine methyltransferase [Megasphaera sp. SW808]|uniref:DNA cytosine methyltransferase n=1 Tax=Megasphaera sp. SW808 TaxID=2530045 RepID=UPI00143B2D6A|nr:DNA cytosine methyltransferase [Megasphaera sp. SW808]
MRILNLYAGLGGNRRLWTAHTHTHHEITAVEYDPEIAAVYQKLYPEDTVIVGDAHAYLEEHYKDYDFIWSSPPCQTHSSFRKNICVRFRGTKAVYPDFRLWQEIVFLQSYAPEGLKWVVENVIPYYRPLIQPTVKLQRHFFWSNFEINPKEFPTEKLRSAQIPDLQRIHGIDLTNVSLRNKRQCLRNCTHPAIGLYVLEQAMTE